jgi:hypothetical protein
MNCRLSIKMLSEARKEHRQFSFLLGRGVGDGVNTGLQESLNLGTTTNFSFFSRKERFGIPPHSSG